MHIINTCLKRPDSGDFQHGFCSVCSSSPLVLGAALSAAKSQGVAIIIEATANQVNQYGGYSGMRPADFANLVNRIPEGSGLKRNNIIIGGDHIGPYPWRGEDELAAMGKAEVLIAEFVKAGFTKIHIDTSMRLGSDDPDEPLPDEVIAERAARLAKVLDQSRLQDKDYSVVLGSEVPLPGGTAATGEVSVTDPLAFEATYESFKNAFRQNSLQRVWNDVSAFVVQPGVEFSEDSVHYYKPGQAKMLMSALKRHPGICFEGHSTDYQPKKLLHAMVRDGVRILKVGPALTFYQREALFALEGIERELITGRGTQLSGFSAVFDDVMVQNPVYWQDYYKGDEQELKFMRKYSLSDRWRYYMREPRMDAAIRRLTDNLTSVNIPYALLSQYMPVQAEKFKNGEIAASPEALIRSRITDCLDNYMYATR
jgi:D-tagatose-1,6-bisphosphate aldolase subunit GatZ/KbaZ